VCSKCQNFNFGPTFSKLEFSAPNFAFLDENFPTRKRFSDNVPKAQIPGGGVLISLAVIPLITVKFGVD